MKKVKKYIIMLFMLLILLLAILIVIYNNPVDKNLRYIYNEKKAGNISVMPNNVTDLFTKYQGRINQRSIYKGLYIFVNEILEKYYLETKSLSNEDVKKYYNQNIKNIGKEIGITQEDEFIKFYETIKNLHGTELSLEEYTINPTTIKNKKGYTECVLLIKYQNNEQIGIYLNILNNKDINKTPINYKGGVEEKDLEYEYIPNDYTQVVQSPGKVVK